MVFSALPRFIPALLGLIGLGLGLPSCAAGRDLPLDRVKLPPGFAIEVYAEVPEARSLSVAPALKTVFVGTLDDAVYAIVDDNGDGQADRTVKVIDGHGLNNTNSVVWDKGTLYLTERHRVLRYAAPDLATLRNAKPEVVYAGMPDKSHHGRRYIAMGPDGNLYVSVGAPCNICRVSGMEGTVLRVDPRGGKAAVFAAGVRNTVGMDFHPATGELYFTDNGGDGMGDDSPPDELNHAPHAGLHFGYPYFGGGTDRTSQFRNETPPPETTPPVVRFGAHVAALGLRFYRGSQFPEEYRRDAFVAQHGSWNRSQRDGYRVARVRFDAQGKATGWEPFAEGFLQPDGGVWGRPVDVATLPDGSLLVSDDYANAVYRISYRGR